MSISNCLKPLRVPIGILLLCLNRISVFYVIIKGLKCNIEPILEDSSIPVIGSALLSINDVNEYFEFEFRCLILADFYDLSV